MLPESLPAVRVSLSANTRPRLLPGLSVTVLSAALLLAGCGDDESAPVPETAETTDTRRIINVEVEQLQTRTFDDVIRLTGTVMADREVTVSAEEGGTVTNVLVDKGAMVKAGDVLVRLDEDLLRAQRDDARAQANLSRALWDRVGPLYEKDGIGTESGYLEARYAAEGADARLALINKRLQRMTIRAPFDGVLDMRLVEVGAVVSPGQAVGQLVDLSPLKVTAGVPERYAADVHVGAGATIGIGAQGATVKATVTHVGARVHPGNRTFLVELSLDTPAAGIKPQMVADVVLQRRRLKDVIVVPRQALVRMEEGFAAFVVSGSGDDATAQSRSVGLGPSAQDQVVITSGLQAGDRLVVIGQNQVANGDRVRIVQSR